MATVIAAGGSPRLWVVGDWNGFFGLFTNVLLNVIVLTGLCLGVVQLPADTSSARIFRASALRCPPGIRSSAISHGRPEKKKGPGMLPGSPMAPGLRICST